MVILRGSGLFPVFPPSEPYSEQAMSYVCARQLHTVLLKLPFRLARAHQGRMHPDVKRRVSVTSLRTKSGSQLGCLPH